MFPEDLSEEVKARLEQVALIAYRALRVRDYGRVDLRMAETGEIYVLEVNASCYMEKSAEFAMAAAKDGIAYEQLVQSIVDLAMERQREKAEAHQRAIAMQAEEKTLV